MTLQLGVSFVGSFHLRHDSCNGFGGTALAGRDHDEHFHDTIVDLAASALDDKDILVTNGSLNADGGLTIAEFLQLGFCWRGAQTFADGFDKERV